ncbi:hypothetical protein EJB05_07834, partial [Eragrostis curvula]
MLTWLGNDLHLFWKYLAVKMDDSEFNNNPSDGSINSDMLSNPVVQNCLREIKRIEKNLVRSLRHETKRHMSVQNSPDASMRFSVTTFSSVIDALTPQNKNIPAFQAAWDEYIRVPMPFDRFDIIYPDVPTHYEDEMFESGICIMLSGTANIRIKIANWLLDLCSPISVLVINFICFKVLQIVSPYYRQYVV